ncbi:DUF5808 domain-containing protein [Paenibacillus jilunlii]|uniref:DUF5808 domain-containing protein n=1 Tax=Paenibacillus jilunlii TaxID=682956 RepID=A0ABR5SNP9_9BACL|nr:DUF5808 domain-containing protein [Paenibacillus jilunlii]KWX71329.1 hypothetical protein AML91_24185 [Paenibacillus jilunlii]
MTVLETIFISSFYLFVALMISIQAHIGLQTLLFGITLPAEALQDTGVRGIRRNYVLLTGGFAVVVGAACFIVTRHQTTSRSFLYWAAAILLLIMMSFFAIRISRMSALGWKAARGWQVAMQTKRAANLVAGRTQGSVLSFWWDSAHVAVMALCIFFVVVRWNAIPQSFATHMGPDGLPDQYTFKSVRTVFMMNLVQALMIVFFAGYNLMICRARTSLDPQDREGSLRKQLKLKKIHSISAWGISLLGIVNIGLLQAVILYGWNLNLLVRCNISFLVLFFLTLIGVLLYLRFRGLDQIRDIPSQEERHWKWLGSIYANPEDPALFVPDRYGFLWTINMANPPGKTVAAAMIAVLVTAILVIMFNFR